MVRPYEGILPVSAATDVSDAVVLDETAPASRRPPRLPPPSLTPRRSLVPGHRDQRLGVRMKAAIVAVGALAAVGTLWSPIVSALPDLSRPSVAIEELEFRKVRSETVRQGGVSTLFVEGEIVNVSSGHVEVPAVVVTMRSDSGAPLGSWRIELATGSLGAGRSLGFRSALAAPPEAAAEVTLSLARLEAASL
jgi:hypothetical protein